MVNPPVLLETRLQITKQLRACQTQSFFHFFRTLLRKRDRDDRGNIRFFSLRHLSNLPPDKVLDADLRLYQAALSKLLNSVSWKEKIVVPEAVDAAKTVFAVDVA